MRLCSIQDCEKPHEARDWCNMHYLRWRNGRPMDTPVKEYLDPNVSLPEHLENLSMPEPNTGCHLWMWVKRGPDYGGLSVGGVKYYAHRLSYELRHGPFSLELKVRHKCDTPLCVNADHLELGTQADNIRDKLERGRHPRGIDSPLAKLNEELVHEIRASKLRGETLAGIAKRLGFPTSTISNVVYGRTWSHVPVISSSSNNTI